MASSFEPRPDSDQPSSAIPGVPDLPADATPEQKDAHWFKHVYQGDRMPQLTIRAVVMGGILGMLMSISNLYTTLAIGWGFGVAITACVMSYVIWNGIRAATGGAASKMSILENNCMQSTAAAAGSSTGATIATMFGALLLLEKVPEGKTAADVASWSISGGQWWVVASFTFLTACLGVFLAVPMKRQMINHEQLRFPSGVAAAETLKSLYSESADAVQRAYTLLIGLLAGLIVGLLNTAEGAIAALDRFFTRIPIRLPETVNLPLTEWVKNNLWFGKTGVAYHAEISLLLIAAGIITRMRVSLSMFIGSAFLYYIVGPYLVKLDQKIPGSGWVANASAPGGFIFDAAQKSVDTVVSIDVVGGGTVLHFTRWSLWGGTAVMVFASLTTLALQWKVVARAFTSLFGGKKAGDDRLAAIEVPNSWMIIGLIPITIGMVVVQYVAFGIAWWAGLIAIAMSFILSMVACRSTGETDTNPIGAMGKVMQLTFAVLKPGQIIPNLASAGVAANSAAASADLLTDLKSGYLLGANPRRQFIAQFVGVFFGTLAIVPAWFLMIPNKAALEKYALPATQQWAAVAKVLTEGLHKLPDSAKYALLIGALVGIAIPLIERLVPKNLRGYLPSAMGLGLSWVIPFGNAFSFLLGAIIVWAWEKLSAKTADRYSVAIASGVIAGESLMKAIIAMTATALGFFASK
ncbi:MAG: OPT/YSL family transporter [Phycisphaerales bacterium]|nr:OPT/YSL family transporter [Phycisphaerales bacterium]